MFLPDYAALLSTHAQFVSETVDAGFNLTANHQLTGIANTYEAFGDVTADVCKHLCLRVISDSCCSLLYNRVTRSVDQLGICV